MSIGSLPSWAHETILASGVRFFSLAAWAEASMTNAAPSLMVLALPAVTVPPSAKGMKHGLSFFKPSIDESALGPSSVSTIFSPDRSAIFTGTDLARWMKHFGFSMAKAESSGQYLTYFVLEAVGLLGNLILLLRSQGELVLTLPADPKRLGNVFS